MKPLRTIPAGALLALVFLTAGCFDSAPWNTTALQLWRTDGTSEGTRRVTRLPSRLWLNWMTPVALGDQVLFTLTDGRRGVELWRSDGTEAGTARVVDLSPGKAEVGGVGPVPDAILAVGKTLFFTFADGVHGPELWKSDGTQAGTGLVKDILPGPEGAFPRQFARLGNRLLFFVEADPQEGRAPALEPALWSSDGTPEGTVPLKATRWSLGAGAAVGEAFLHREGTSYQPSNRLWRSDGQPGGNLLLGDFPSGPADCVATRRLLVCAVLDELGISDGTAQGTRRVRSIPDLQSETLVGTGERVYFAAAPQDGPRQLWTSDGTVPGTVSLATFPDLGPKSFGDGFARGEPNELTPLGDTLYFGGFAPDTGYELWRSDGTVAGTRPVTDLEPGPTGSYPRSLRVLGDRLIFSTSRGLWASDGTAAGTTLIHPDNHYAEVTVAKATGYWVMRP